MISSTNDTRTRIDEVQISMRRGIAEAESAAGVKGVLIRMVDGAFAFRVYHDKGDFSDYSIRHDELSVTIDSDELAAFYKMSEHCILDHSPQVLGLMAVPETK